MSPREGPPNRPLRPARPSAATYLRHHVRDSREPVRRHSLRQGHPCRLHSGHEPRSRRQPSKALQPISAIAAGPDTAASELQPSKVQGAIELTLTDISIIASELHP
jgi:hypothetical protein